jgi:pimeloyl-ACP methyl ester carboxylesterase
MFVQARAGRIFVDDAGISDCPIVFIHSLAGNTQHWEHQLEHVRTYGCGLAFDLRGHGQSNLPEDGDYSLEACGDDLLAVTDALGIHECLLVGHSLGAAIATVFAATFPERVRGLLLVDPVGDQRLASDEMQKFLVALDSPRYHAIIRDYWTTIAGPNLKLQERLLADLEHTPREAVLGMLRALNRTDLTNAILSYTGPKLSVVTPLNEFPFSLHRLDPDLPHKVFPGTGHWLQLELPDAFNFVLDDFVQSIHTAD